MLPARKRVDHRLLKIGNRCSDCSICHFMFLEEITLEYRLIQIWQVVSATTLSESSAWFLK